MPLFVTYHRAPMSNPPGRRRRPGHPDLERGPGASPRARAGATRREDSAMGRKTEIVRNLGTDVCLGTGVMMTRKQFAVHLQESREQREPPRRLKEMYDEDAG